MSIDAEEAAIRTVIVGALMGHSEAGERGFDALFAMRRAEAIGSLSWQGTRWNSRMGACPNWSRLGDGPAEGFVFRQVIFRKGLAQNGG